MPPTSISSRSFLSRVLCMFLVSSWTSTTTTTLAWTLPTTTTCNTQRRVSSSSSFTWRLKMSSSEPPPNSSDASSEKDVINQEIQLQNNPSVSFDDAGRKLVEEEDKARLEESGDFDTNPAYKSDNMDQMRAAIRKRTQEMGLEKSVLSKQVIQEASERAKRGEATNLNSLDLTKIRGNIPENMPTVLYDPEDEMSQEEREEVDPVGQTSIINQFQNELSNAKWPTAGAVFREVGIMLVVVASTAALIIFWDKFLRNFYTNELHLIPTKEEMQTRFSGLELPEGWTNMMTDDDVANLPSELRDAASSAAASSSSSASGATGGGLPDL